MTLGGGNGSLASILILGSLAAAAPADGGAITGGCTGGSHLALSDSAPDQSAHHCISDEERHALHALRPRFDDKEPSVALPLGEPEGAPPYAFLPVGARSHRDVLIVNFVDVIPEGGAAADFNCTSPPLTWDWHRGNDVMIRTFAEQLIGVPVFAAMDGVVVSAHDGEFDMNVQCAPGVAGNSVAINHGSGKIAYYWHMRNGSVSVTPGQIVKAGQQIGQIGSSGCSSWPHLHFETTIDGWTYEPFAGPCRPGPSGWLQQESLNLNMFVYNFAPSRTNPNSPGLPQLPPGGGRDRQVLLSDPLVHFWVQIANLPASSNWQVKFIRPNGTTAFTSPVTAFQGPGGSNPFYRSSWWSWSYNVINQAQIPGTWRIQLFINGVLQVDGPVDAVASINPNQNAPPVAITASIEPAAPTSDAAIFCRVTAPLILDDPDYNVVRYHYEWRVNGYVVRDVITAGHADAIARGIACAGSHVECRVRPFDGSLYGPLAIASASLPGPSNGDINCDGVVGVIDLLAVINLWGTCPTPPAGCPGDVNADGTVNVSDLLLVINSWS